MIKKVFAFLLLLTIISRANGQGWDLRLEEHINGPISSTDQSWQNITGSVYFTTAGVPLGMLVTGLATHNKELTTKAFETGGSILIAAGVTVTLKALTHRQRPYLAHPDLIVGKATSSDYSFPSGHTSLAFATATSLSLSLPKWYVIAPAFTYAAAVCYSRMYLGVHYPTDVFAGALVGVGSTFLTWKLQKALFKNYNKKVNGRY